MIILIDYFEYFISKIINCFGLGEKISNRRTFYVKNLDLGQVGLLVRNIVFFILDNFFKKEVVIY